MKALWNELIENESGVILSAELILIVTIAVLGLVTGLSCVQQAVVYELTDIGMAISALNQSYSTPSYFSFKQCGGGMGGGIGGGMKSFSAGSGFFDFYDGCAGVTSGSTAVGYSGVGQTAVYGVSDINTGVGSSAIPLRSPSPIPNSITAPMTVPCEGCPTGSEVVVPTPAAR